MNLGDGLLFELENGKPKVILLSTGVEKNARKLSSRPRPANVLSTRQPSCVEKVQGEEFSAQPQSRRYREVKSKTGGVAASSASSAFSSTAATATARRSTAMTLTKPQEQAKEGWERILSNGRSDGHNHREKTGHLQKGETVADATMGVLDSLALKDLTAEQLQHLLNIVETTCCQGPSESHHTRGNQTDSGCVSPVTDGGGVERRLDQDGEEGELTDGCHATVSSLGQNRSLPGGLFGWLDERPSASRAAISSKKAQWRRELDEQVAQKQQTHWSAPLRAQHPGPHAEEECVSHKEQPAALRSNLRLGVITPIEEALSFKRREEQKRRWLEELDKQREETTERRRREKQLQSQPEDHELWASHFDSLQRKPPVPVLLPIAPTPAPLQGVEQREWEATSRLSLLSEAMSTCGGESVRVAAVDTTSGNPARTSYLRSMTALLDPAQLEERERRRMKQAEQQRAIEAQVEEKRRHREREEAMKRKEEEEEERRLSLEREMLEKRYELDRLKERQAHRSQPEVQPSEGRGEETVGRTPDPDGELCSCRISACRDADGPEKVRSSARTYRDTAVQTEATVRLPLTGDGVPAPAPAPANRKNQTGRRGKENICLQGEGADPYEPFARTEQRKEARRPEWNTHRPSQQFVPASERYAASAQKNRQERRLKRQAELLALQGRSCPSRSGCTPYQEPQPCPTSRQGRSSPTRKGDAASREHSSTADAHGTRSRAPAVPVGTHRHQSRQDPPPATPPVPGVGFIPYVRTHEVFNLDPLEPDDIPPPRAQAEATPAPSHRDPPLLPELIHGAHNHQETLRSLAQLRRGLLQKQRELERDLSPVLKHFENKPR
ncbi:coiled-coil domain-containing protein 66 isoform X2 [Takifugu flavidus]|uniref:coiled-coil domain-containing protein 66 isoform X2 n=1 Tax=Takifugu flavidus TaxID=433684 RepID=UPI002544A216|nr:coiled-coil domain-containing protein 66 isoform X2 [Takifugu flavidus]